MTLTSNSTMTSIGADTGCDFGEMPVNLKNFLKKNDETLKDLDFINLTIKYGKIFNLNLSNDKIRKILKFIENDVEFLREHNLMDYSILIGIEEVLVLPKFLEDD